jgi:hypothetical protein
LMLLRSKRDRLLAIEAVLFPAFWFVHPFLNMKYRIQASICNAFYNKTIEE